MNEFLTTQKTSPPQIPLFWYGVILVAMAGVIWLSLRHATDGRVRRLFRAVQLVQLVMLYLWYIVYSLPLSSSLPLYHCRIAMLGILFLPRAGTVKQYIALLGVTGALFALVYPVFDPYDFPHITSLSFLLGHYALLGNSLSYLMISYDKNCLSRKTIVYYTSLLNLLLVGVNYLTGGNYGLLSRPPLMTHRYPILTYLVVTFVLVLALFFIHHVFSYRQERLLRQTLHH